MTYQTATFDALTPADAVRILDECWQAGGHGRVETAPGGALMVICKYYMPMLIVDDDGDGATGGLAHLVAAGRRRLPRVIERLIRNPHELIA